MEQPVGEARVAEGGTSGRRQPAQCVGKDELEHETEPEHGKGDAGDAGDDCEPIEAAADRAEDTRHERDDQGEQRRRAHQLERGGHAFHESVEHRPAVGVAEPPIATNEGREPGHILRRQRSIEAELMAQPRDVLRPHVRVLEVHLDRPARRCVNEREHQNGHDEQ